MKNLTKIGEIRILKSRPIYQNNVRFASFELDGVKFDETFAARNLQPDNGDLIYVEYESNGISNKIILLEKIARDGKAHAAFFAFWLILSAFFVCAIAAGLLNGAINFSGLDGLLALLFLAPAAIFTLKAVANNFKILRLL